jgi:hypothetical protein
MELNLFGYGFIGCIGGLSYLVADGLNLLEVDFNCTDVGLLNQEYSRLHGKLIEIHLSSITATPQS